MNFFCSKCGLRVYVAKPGVCDPSCEEAAAYETAMRAADVAPPEKAPPPAPEPLPPPPPAPEPEKVPEPEQPAAPEKAPEPETVPEVAKAAPPGAKPAKK